MFYHNKKAMLLFINNKLDMVHGSTKNHTHALRKVQICNIIIHILPLSFT